MKLVVVMIACCLIALAAAQKAQPLSAWEKFDDGSTGRITVFQGVGGVSIPAYIRKPAGQGPFPVVVMLHGNQASKEETYALGRSTGHPTADFIASRWAVYSIDFRPNPPLSLDPRECDAAVAAIQAVHHMPFIDAGRVALFGGSHGANVFARVAARADVRSAVLRAPAVSDLEAAGVRCPLLIINGRDDTASPVAVIDAYVAKLRADAKHVETYFPEPGEENKEAARRAVSFIRTYFNAGGAPYEYLRPLFDYDSKAPLELQEVGVQTRGGIQVHDITYASPRGGRVTASLFVPPGQGPFAGMIFMHGGGGNRGQMALAATMFAKTGAVCLTLDAPYSAGRAIPGQEIQDWEHPERTRDGFIQTVVDMRRGVDVLLARPDVDPKRLGYYGGSFGALTGGVLAGVEHRIKAYVLMSSPSSINDAQIERVLRTFRTIPKEELARSRAIIETVAPVYYIGHAAPSALFMQIGDKDTGVPRESAARLHQAASDPKLIRWYDGDHGLNNQARLDSAEWLRKQIGIGPLDPADRQRLEAPVRK